MGLQLFVQSDSGSTACRSAWCSCNDTVGPGAADPVGGTSLFDAFEKQLGLKLEPQKRSYPVFVIDHIEEKPTEN